MSYDQGLAERLRELLVTEAGISERAMFGGLAFMVDGKMFVGINDERLMARVGPGYYETALAMPHVAIMDFTGRPLKGYVYLAPEAFQRDSDLGEWVVRCLGFVRGLPLKKRK